MRTVSVLVLLAFLMGCSSSHSEVDADASIIEDAARPVLPDTALASPPDASVVSGRDASAAEPDAGAADSGGPEITGSEEDLRANCAAVEERAERCGLGPAPVCAVPHGARYLARRDFLLAVTRCIAETPCEQSDDHCVEQFLDRESDRYRACSSKLDTCGIMFDGLCELLPTFVPSAVETIEGCLELECAEIGRAHV